ncbi:hypothetical protein C8F01DRAFT_1094672 [Mycena amicta]|nr:hypothetical protein C8F01DRAFT_1094672 [Mycena amicta]
MQQIFLDVTVPRDTYRPELFGFVLEEATPFYAYHGNAWVIQPSSTWLYGTERVPAESRNLIGSAGSVPSQVSEPNHAFSEANSSAVRPPVITPRALSPDAPRNNEDDRVSLGSVEAPVEIQCLLMDEPTLLHSPVAGSSRYPITPSARHYSPAPRRYSPVRQYRSPSRDSSPDQSRGRTWSQRFSQRSYSRSRSRRYSRDRGHRYSSPFRTRSHGRQSPLSPPRKGKKRRHESSLSSSALSSS